VSPFKELSARMAYRRRDTETAEEHAARLQAILQLRDQAAEWEAERQERDADGYAQSFEVETEGSRGLEDAEAALVAQSVEKQSPMVLELLKGLQQCAVYTDTPNHETNRKLWDAYAGAWSSDVEWVQRMSGHVSRRPDDLKFVGDEWSDVESLNEVLSEWIFPYVKSEIKAAEVGSGGGRIAAKVAPTVGSLVCFDVSERMLAKAKDTVVGQLGHQNVKFQLVQGDIAYPTEHDEQFDFVYSFDVFVHMDLHQMRHTLGCIHKMMRSGSLCFVSFANLLAPDGWRRFAKQRNYTVGGFYFVSPDIALCLLRHIGFKVVKMSQPRESNTYLNRDLLVIAQKA